jgi:hypothetical protein
MSRKIAFGRFLMTALCFLLIGGVSKAHAGAGCSALSLTIDSRTVNLCIFNQTGPPIQNGTRLLAGVGTSGVRCPGCSANVTCYAAQDGTFQYHNVMIFTIYTTVDLQGTTFYWSPAYGPGPYYLACTITYDNNPYVNGTVWTHNVDIEVE